MANIIAEKGINYAVYLDGDDQLGIAEAEFPQLDVMTSEVKGAGIAGTADTPVLGHFNSMTMTLTWRNITQSFSRLTAHKTHELDLYLAQQDFDAGAGEYKVGSVHAFIRGIPKNLTLGNLTVGETTGTQTELEVIYIRLEIDGREALELDKYNYIYRVEGVDYLADVRSALGKI